LTLTDVHTGKQWNGWPAGSLHVDFDGKLERYARVDRAGNVSVRRVSDDFELWNLAGLGPREAWANLSSDGHFLVVWNTRFKLWSFVQPLKALGMRRAFQRDQAQFGGITDSRDPKHALYISQVLQKTFIEVDEKGTEAAAATALGSNVPMSNIHQPKTRPFVPVFRANRPFLFLIRHVDSGSILFMGRMANPGS
jgi:hypothetical protein